LFTVSYDRWSADRASRIAAALSFSITFAARPLLIVGMTIAGWVLEGESVRAAINDMWGVQRNPRRGLVRTLLSTIGERLS